MDTPGLILNPVFASDGAAMDGFGADADIHENFAIIGAKMQQ